MSKETKTPNNDIFTAYIELVASTAQTTADVYTKMWQDSAKFQQTVSKNTAELFSSNDMYRNFSNIWHDYTSWPKK